MKDSSRTYVLVPGAWHGGWVFRPVAEGLRAHGYTVTTPTLTGLGERRHIGRNIDLDTHVEDVVAHIEMEDLYGITLVGWSYGGMVITGVLARIPEKISAMIYLDAFVPQDGWALTDYLPSEFRSAQDKFKDADAPIPPLPFASFGLTDPKIIQYITPKLTDHPWRTLYQPVKALSQWPDIPIAYIRCTANNPSPLTYFMEQMEKDPHVKTDVINADHFCMYTAIDETIRLLDKYGSHAKSPPPDKRVWTAPRLPEETRWWRK